jgi:hypothetical protein
MIRCGEFKLFNVWEQKSMTIEVIMGSESSLSIVNNRSSNNSSSLPSKYSVGYGAEVRFSGSSSNSSNSGHNSNRGTQEDLQTSRATIQRFNPTKKSHICLQS